MNIMISVKCIFYIDFLKQRFFFKSTHSHYHLYGLIFFKTLKNELLYNKSIPPQQVISLNYERKIIISEFTGYNEWDLMKKQEFTGLVNRD
jgi:hypothetical protein